MGKVKNFQEEFSFDDILIAQEVAATHDCGLSRIALRAPNQKQFVGPYLIKGCNRGSLSAITLKLHYAIQVWCQAAAITSESNDAFQNYWWLDWAPGDGPFNIIKYIERRIQTSDEELLHHFWELLEKIADSGDIQVTEGYWVNCNGTGMYGPRIDGNVIVDAENADDIKIDDIRNYPFNKEPRSYKWREIKDFFVELTLDQLRLTKPEKLHNHTELDDVLLKACEMWNETIIKQALAQGANINCLDSLGRSVLQRAVEGFSCHGMRDILGNGDTSEPTFEENMQHCQQIVDLLLSYGADINLFGYDGILPLDCAYYENSPEMMEFLLERGASPNINSDYKDLDLCTPQLIRSQRNIRSTLLDNIESALQYEYDEVIDKCGQIVRAAGGRQYVWDYTPWNEENVGRYVVKMMPTECNRDIFTDNSNGTIGTSQKLTIEDRDGNQTVISLESVSNELQRWNADYHENRANHNYDWAAWKQRGLDLARRVAQLLPESVALFCLYDNEQIVEKYDAVDHTYPVRKVYLCTDGGPIRVK